MGVDVPNLEFISQPDRSQVMWVCPSAMGLSFWAPISIDLEVYLKTSFVWKYNSTWPNLLICSYSPLY